MISQTGRHALGALVELARLPDGEHLGAAVLARRIDAPANYLGKLLQSLAQRGLLVSRKGPGGGFRLAREANTVTLLAILSPVEKLERFDRCVLGLAECSDEAACAIHESWKTVRESYLNLLSTTTLADVLNKPRTGPVAAATTEAEPGAGSPRPRKKT